MLTRSSPFAGTVWPSLLPAARRGGVGRYGVVVRGPHDHGGGAGCAHRVAPAPRGAKRPPGHGSARASAYLPPVSSTRPVTASRISAYTTSCRSCRPASASTAAALV